ncbi:MAG: hypothetical protein MJZ00_05150 [Paludibacteraceae bacterium]|nr:hypothetical protein [Paludibacteraceae bacterium]
MRVFLTFLDFDLSYFLKEFKKVKTKNPDLNMRYNWSETVYLSNWDGYYD